MSKSTLPITVAIPTYNRGAIVVETIRMLLDMAAAPQEILIIDQSGWHPEGIRKTLHDLNEEGAIRWILREQPSITKAMNHALNEASNSLILFLDDDIEPSSELIENHYRNFSDGTVSAVVGQVLQPGEVPEDLTYVERQSGLWKGLDFPFNSKAKVDVNNVMAGNLSLRVNVAKEIGGFDENFRYVAYRFETDFARRLTLAGHRIVYEPEAGIHHLRIRTGGTRNRANHLTSARPDHSVGDYYYAFKHGRSVEAFRYCFKRFTRSFATRFHLTHPWYIPSVMIGEIRGMWMAWNLSRSGDAEDQRTSQFAKIESNQISTSIPEPKPSEMKNETIGLEEVNP